MYYFSDFCVGFSYRKLRIGKKLLESAIAEADLKKKNCALHCLDDVHEFYKKFGFRDMEKKDEEKYGLNFSYGNLESNGVNHGPVHVMVRDYVPPSPSGART